ncbi:unnamed protein product, partial [Didymodactylos carnosus]
DLDEKITRKLLSNKQYDTVLELGCGTGKNTLFYSAIGKNVDSVDFCQSMLDIARLKVEQQAITNVIIYQTDLKQKQWSRESNYYDLCACNLMLEHIENIEPFFMEVNRILKINGEFFVSELHPYKQYLGTKANGVIQSFTHHISDFLHVGKKNGFTMKEMQEWWTNDEETEHRTPPRLVTFIFEKMSTIS